MLKRRFARVRIAQKDRGFLHPNYKPSVRLLLILIGKLYIRIVESVYKVDGINKNNSIKAMKNFLSGRERLIFVFRHAAKEDPSVLVYYFLRKIRKEIQASGGKSQLSVLYGRDVPNWAGNITAWLFPRFGAIPVQNFGGNKEALTILRREVTKGDYPLALAPEGQVVYHMYKSFNIVPGISALVRWGLESNKPVRVVPISIGYKFTNNPEAFIRDRLRDWETQTGIKLKNRDTDKLFPLLCRATQETLSIVESLCEISPCEDDALQDATQLDERINKICLALLDKAEKEAGIKQPANLNNSSIIERLFRLRYKGVDAFYTKDDPNSLSPINRGLLDFKALKAETFIRYERIVDVLEYVNLDYIKPPFSSGRGCEYILNLLDVINRIKGGNINTRFNPKKKTVTVLSGTPLLYNPSKIKLFTRKDFLQKVKYDVSKALEKISKELEEHLEKEKIE